MKLSVILVVSLEKADVVRTALESLFSSRPGFPIEVIVVDNASREAAFALEPFRSRLTVIRNEENLGFTYAVKGSTGNPSVYVNPLSAIAPGFLRRLFEFGSSLPPEPAAPPAAAPQQTAPEPAAPTP